MRLSIQRIVTFFPRRNVVQWALQTNEVLPAGSYKFKVYRSGGPVGPWELIADLADAYGYSDELQGTTPGTGPDLFATYRTFYYKVQCVTPTQTVLEAIEEIGPIPSGMAKNLLRKIQYEFNMALKSYAATDIAILKRRRWGTRCTVCFDKKTGRSLRADCDKCYGTTYEGGYWTPFYTRAIRSPGNNSTALTSAGKTDLSDGTVKIPSYPIVERQDIIVFLADQSRHEVQVAPRTEIQLAPAYQFPTAIEIPRDNVIYRLALQPRSKAINGQLL